MGIRFKSATTRGGTVSDIYLHNIEMGNVWVPVEVSMNRNPSCSYFTLPEVYTMENFPAH